MSDLPEPIIVREMGYSVDEFTRVLPLAMRDFVINELSDGWRVSDAELKLIATIRIAPLPERRMGSLSLPVLRVTLDLGASGGVQAAAFLRRFDRGFHRGGG